MKKKANHIGLIIEVDDNEEFHSHLFLKLKFLLKQQVKNDIPIITIYFEKKLSEQFYKKFRIFLKNMNRLFNDNMVRVVFLGKWYNLNGDLVSEIKKISEITSKFEKFFFNFCIHYDGQEEILNAMKILAVKVREGLIEPENITKEDIKENLYTSYFVPPDVIIKIGKIPKSSGFLLWDSKNSIFYFLNEDFQNVQIRTIIDIIKKGNPEKRFNLKRII